MGKKAKIVKQKKRIPWKKIGYYFKTLYKNDVAMDCGLRTKWWISIIVMLVSILVAAIPQVVNSTSTNGSDYVNNTSSDSMIIGLSEYANDDESFDIVFEEGKAHVAPRTINGNTEIYTYDGNPANPLYSFTHHDETTGKDVVLLDIYFITIDKEDALFATQVSQIERRNNVDETNTRSSSYILFTEEYFQSQLYRAGLVNSVVGGVSGDYTRLRGEETTKSFKSLLLAPVETSEIGVTATINQNYLNFANDVYLNNKEKLTWVNFGIICALNGGMTLLMGFMIWVLTRGKSNPLKHTIKWYSGFLIVSWLSFTPALLALILGFFLPQMGMIFYIFLFGVRAMWLVSKYLKGLPPETKK